MLRAMASLVKPDLCTLLTLHIEARGEYSSNLTHAQHVLLVDLGITSFDTAQIVADFL